MTFYAGSGSLVINVEQIFEEVFQAHSQQEQLKAIKKVILIYLCTVIIIFYEFVCNIISNKCSVIQVLFICR